MAVGFGTEYVKKLARCGFPGGKVLDVGCGFGATNLTLADHFPDSEFVGIDLSDPLLEIARERSEARGVSGRVRFERADVQDIPFEDDSFEVLINLNMVHLVDDPLAMLNEMERVLAPGGILFLADLKRSVLGILEKEIRSALSTGEAKQLIQESTLRAGDFSSGLVWWRYESLPEG
jgi:ubiquinone/menaquinone biosynthesis C-methylase UbiE